MDVGFALGATASFASLAATSRAGALDFAVKGLPTRSFNGASRRLHHLLDERLVLRNVRVLGHAATLQANHALLTRGAKGHYVLGNNPHALIGRGRICQKTAAAVHLLGAATLLHATDVLNALALLVSGFGIAVDHVVRRNRLVARARLAARIRLHCLAINLAATLVSAGADGAHTCFGLSVQRLGGRPATGVHLGFGISRR